MRVQWLLILPLLLAIGCKQPTPTGGGTGAKNSSGAAGRNEVANKPLPAPSIGEAAPEIEGADLEGVDFKLSDYRGKVVVLDFWGDW